MKAIRIATWINIFLYIFLLSIPVWVIFNVARVIGPRLHEIVPSRGFFYSVILHIPPVILSVVPPVFCIIGLLRRRNWGRILSIIVNLFVVIVLSGNIIYMIFIKELNFLQAMTSQTAFLTYIAAIPFIALTIALFRKEAKLYFVRSKR